MKIDYIAAIDQILKYNPIYVSKRRLIRGKWTRNFRNCNTVQFMRDIKIIKGTFQGIDDE